MTPELAKAAAYTVIKRFVPETFPLIQTTDDEPALIAKVEIPNNTAGKMEVTVIAFNDDSTEANTGVYFQAFRKSTVLTLLAYDEMLTASPEMASTVAILNQDENIAIQITGEAGKTINWACEVRVSPIIQSAGILA